MTEYNFRKEIEVTTYEYYHIEADSLDDAKEKANSGQGEFIDSDAAHDIRVLNIDEWEVNE